MRFSIHYLAGKRVVRSISGRSDKIKPSASIFPVTSKVWNVFVSAPSQLDPRSITGWGHRASRKVPKRFSYVLCQWSVLVSGIDARWVCGLRFTLPFAFCLWPSTPLLLLFPFARAVSLNWNEHSKKRNRAENGWYINRRCFLATKKSAIRLNHAILWILIPYFKV